MVSTIDCFFFGVCVDYSFHSNCEEQLPSTDSRPTVSRQLADIKPTGNQQVSDRWWKSFIRHHISILQNWPKQTYAFLHSKLDVKRTMNA